MTRSPITPDNTLIMQALTEIAKLEARWAELEQEHIDRRKGDSDKMGREESDLHDRLDALYETITATKATTPAEAVVQLAVLYLAFEQLGEGGLVEWAERIERERGRRAFYSAFEVLAAAHLPDRPAVLDRLAPRHLNPWLSWKERAAPEERHAAQAPTATQ
jgi:hypothetical protein